MSIKPTEGRASSEQPEQHDFLDLDALLSEEERAVRDEVRAFVRERIKPNIERWWEEAVLFP